MSDWWIREKIKPEKVQEILKSRGKLSTNWEIESLRAFLERWRTGNLRIPKTNTMIACPNKCGYSLNYFRVTTASFLITKSSGEDENTARLRYFALVSGFMCRTCGKSFFLSEFNDEMRQYVLQLARADTTKVTTERTTKATSLDNYF